MTNWQVVLSYSQWFIPAHFSITREPLLIVVLEHYSDYVWAGNGLEYALLD